MWRIVFYDLLLRAGKRPDFCANPSFWGLRAGNSPLFCSDLAFGGRTGEKRRDGLNEYRATGLILCTFAKYYYLRNMLLSASTSDPIGALIFGVVFGAVGWFVFLLWALSCGYRNERREKRRKQQEENGDS